MTDPTKPPPGINIRDTADAVRGAAEAIPVYQDAVQPAAKEVGKGLETIAKTINVALAPLEALVWGYDQFKEFLSTKVAERLSETPPEDIAEPKLHVAGPALEALRFTGHEESLRDLYANLLAASMDVTTASLAHPSFVEIIKQLTPDEARLMTYFSTASRLPVIDIRGTHDDRSGYYEAETNISLYGRDASCEHPHLTPTYLDNLSRLGLIEIAKKFYTDEAAYEELENHPSVLEIKKQVNEEESVSAQVDRKVVQITQLGEQFIRACVIDHREIHEAHEETPALPEQEPQ
jgi:hypothetical protein